MKKVFRFSGLALFGMAVLGFSATGAAAQSNCEDADGITAADAKVRENYPKIETRKIAVEAGKEYLEKYGECEVTKDFVAWLKPQLPKWEQQVKEYEEWLWRKPRIERFDGGIKAGKWDDVYAAGNELVGRYPNDVGFMLPMAIVGLQESYKNNFKYNEDAIRYAKMAIAKLKDGSAEVKKDGKGNPILDKTGKEVYGPFQFERNKEDALSELTYALAYINYHAKKDRKAGLPYYYEVSQMPGLYKEEPRLYASIGQFYVDESNPIGLQIGELIKKIQAATTDEEKEKLDAEVKPKVALYYGYIERALDAFGRAHKYADEKIASEKTIKAEVYKTMQSLYERRFEKTEGLDTWVATTIAKPMPNPLSEVSPVVDPDPVTTTTSATPAATPANGKGAVATKPKQ
ncbi:MAG: hypothetical protein IPM25_15380 [Chloracidobacterium sp.]|nr:hypothetical protein [Chloracidobacterium sp.]